MLSALALHGRRATLAAAMAETLKEEVRAAFERGGGEAAGDTRFLPLVTLESETRYGLDPDGAWIGVPTDGRPPFRCEPGSEHMFYEALESKRDDFEARLTEGARAAGLPAEEVVLSFPAVAVVRAVLAKEHPYMARLALLWPLPSELRELRADIVRISKSPSLSTPIKDLAQRLIVPE